VQLRLERIVRTITDREITIRMAAEGIPSEIPKPHAGAAKVISHRHYNKQDSIEGLNPLITCQLALPSDLLYCVINTWFGIADGMQHIY
jgi:hypothetical protein